MVGYISNDWIWLDLLPFSIYILIYPHKKRKEKKFKLMTSISYIKRGLQSIKPYITDFFPFLSQCKAYQNKNPNGQYNYIYAINTLLISKASFIH